MQSSLDIMGIAWSINVRPLIVVSFALLLSLNSFGQTPGFSTNATSFDFGGLPIGGIPEIPPGPERDIVITNNGSALYNLVFTATSGTTTHTAPATLIVQ